MRCSRNSVSLLRNSRSCGDIMATGAGTFVCGASGGALYQSAECLTLQGFPNHSQNDSTWQTEGFAMGQAIAVRMDYTSDEVRQLAKRAKDASQARRLLAIAVVLDGASREEAAKAGGMERQTLRDWVIRFNEKGPDGLVNK